MDEPSLICPSTTPGCIRRCCTLRVSSKCRKNPFLFGIDTIPRVKSISSIVCRCQSANACVPDGAIRSRGAPFVATVPPRRRNFLAAGISSIPQTRFRSPLLPAVYHDLTALHELAFGLPIDASLLCDLGFIAADDAKSLFEATGVHLVISKRKNKAPNTWAAD